jgi:hypothetical protein
MPDRCILAVKYTPASAPRPLRLQVGGFLRYIQYRDRPAEGGQDLDREARGVIKYVAHRDRSASRALLFDRAGTVGDEERRRLTDYVSRSLQGSRPHPTRDGELSDRRRAVYRFVLSPEHAPGLDLRRLTEAAMEQLESDLGAPLPPWIAAEHRNTKHPHVHVVLAARSEVSSGRFRGVMVTRPRLQGMKDALAREIERQRGLEPSPRIEVPSRAAPKQRVAAVVQSQDAAAEGSKPARSAQPRPAWSALRPSLRRTRSRPYRYVPSHAAATHRLLRRLAADYRWQAEQEALETLRNRGREAFA